MSEYQYYEFLALDRPLSEADRSALRKLSSRARITATSFTNSYQWGDFKGNPSELMARWFDLHLYLTNWGTRRLMIRLPARLVDRDQLRRFLGDVDCAELDLSGDNLILDIQRGEIDTGDDWGDDSEWLAGLAQLRADILGGDLRLFYLLWLTAVEQEIVEADVPEPLPGIGPLTDPLEAFAGFFGIDPDLIAAAAERSGAQSAEGAPAPEAVRRLLAKLPDAEKTDLLARLADGDAHVATEVRALVRSRLTSGQPTPSLRTAGELRDRAEAIRADYERAEAERQEAERQRRAAEEQRAQRARLDAIKKRGEAVWREIETDIERRNPAGYDNATRLLQDLKAIADEQRTTGEFSRRLSLIRERHARKERFIERLKGLG
jgi:hypothetical protein